LRCSWNRRLKVRRPLVHIIAAEDISEEHRVEFGSFELLRKGDPMLDVVVLASLIRGILEQARVQVARRLHHEGIEDPLLLGSCHDGRMENDADPDASCEISQGGRRDEVFRRTTIGICLNINKNHRR
jgi:hypothetical protein